MKQKKHHTIDEHFFVETIVENRVDTFDKALENLKIIV